MGFLSNLGKSIVSGGAVKEVGKNVVKGIKGGAGKVAKGLKRKLAPKLVRGIKSSSAQTQALPTAIREAVAIGRALPAGFGTSNTTRVMINKLSQNLANASKGALNKDAAERLAKKLAKNLTDKKKAKVLKDILKNARAGETWGKYLARNAKVGAGLVKSVIKGGAENIAIDKSISLTSKLLGAGVGGVATGVTTAAIINRTNKKK